jgi:hypothetical protein
MRFEKEKTDEQGIWDDMRFYSVLKAGLVDGA